MCDPFTLPSFAKINWMLRVIGRRPDGFHEIFTIYQTVSLFDEIVFSPSDDLLLTVEGAELPTDDNNLIVAAARRLHEAIGANPGAAITLRKKIPSPGGLAGGSSNAAVALIGLSRLWDIDSPTLLPNIARELGSDVQFFLHGGTAIGSGRGELIEPTAEIAADMIIVTPNVAVPTAAAYRGLNAEPLTTERCETILRVCREKADAFSITSSAFENDFEQSVFAQFPEIGRAKQSLIDLGARRALLSGSGASVFAIFDNEETRQAAMKALDHESTWRKFAVSTISRAKYREALG